MSYASSLLSGDFVWSAIMSAMAGRRRKSSGTKFINICCPMCIYRGESPDKRYRCGVKNDAGIGIYCYNCKFKTRWKIGEPLSKNIKEFLLRLGTDDIEIKRISHRAFTLSTMIHNNPEAQVLADIQQAMVFPKKSLPKGAASFEHWADRGCTDQNFLDTAAYLFGRGSDIAASSTYYWTPDPGLHGLNRRVIIPMYHEGSIVGYSARAIDEEIKNRYHSEVSPDYMFNNSVMGDRSRNFILLVEGIFDAIALDAVGTLGARLNDRQIAWIDSHGKNCILLPDRDRSGQEMIDIALKRKWHIAFPALNNNMASRNWWESDVKDAAEAVKRYGRLYTLTSIIKSATANEVEIAVKRRALYD